MKTKNHKHFISFQAFQKYRFIILVNATSGTTVLGAYDDLSSLAEVCQAFSPKIWLHVDACWGGSAILSPKLQFLMKGAEHVDSLVYYVPFNLHSAKILSPYINIWNK